MSSYRGEGAATGQEARQRIVPDNGDAAKDDTVESVMNDLAIERRILYGAEKMLDVIEKRREAEDGDQDQMKERIELQLEAAEDRIRMLEAKLEKLKIATPHRSKRRPQPRINAYGSSSSLVYGPSVASSYSSSSMLNASRPKPSRQASGLSERDASQYPLPATPSRGLSTIMMTSGSSSRHGRTRSSSMGVDPFGSPEPGDPLGVSRMGWAPGVPSPQQAQEGVAENVAAVDVAQNLLQRLRDLTRLETEGKGKEKRGARGIVESIHRLADLMKNSENLKVSLNTEELIQGVLPHLADSSTSRRRAAAFRLLRYANNRQMWGRWLEAGVEWLIVRTLARGPKYAVEREQAIKLLRFIIRLQFESLHPLSPSQPRSYSRRNSVGRPASAVSRRRPSSYALRESTLAVLSQRVPLPDGLVRALVACGENPDDPLRLVSLQTLIETGMLDFDRLIRTDAFRVVLLILREGPYELGPSVTALLLTLTNAPHTRHLLVPGSDVESVLVGFTEGFGAVPVHQHNRQVEKYQGCLKNTILLLGTWPGIIYLCSGERRAIKSIIGSLRMSNIELRDALLDLMFSLFRIKLPNWKDAFLDGKRLTVYNRAQEAITSDLRDEAESSEAPEKLNLIDQLVALLLAVFLESGLVEVLVSLIGENTDTINRKATLLLGEILHKANRLLPLQYAAQIQALPELFSHAMAFRSHKERASALSALASIGSLARNTLNSGRGIPADGSGTSYIQDSLDRGQQQLRQQKISESLQIDDRQFLQLINDTGVILGNDHTKWNYDIIVELLQGPLLNAKRLDEAIKATKFLKRLSSFFHPYNSRFSSIKRNRWVKLGCLLLSTLLVNPEGVKFLTEDRLLSQLAECMKEIDALASQPTLNPIFTTDRIERSLTYGYFEMIGTLSKQPEGIKLLERFKFFTSFYHLSEQANRDQCTRALLECLDYTMDSHPRTVLSKALTSGSRQTRLFATHHLGRMMLEDSALLEWSLPLIITQLYDSEMEICDIALMYLEELCSERDGLEKVVLLQPGLEHLGDIGHPLFMKFVSTSAGFLYLHRASYIDREYDLWTSERNHLYVIEVETWVSQTVRPFSSDNVEDYWTYDGAVPTHFLGELTKTTEGCMYLKERGIVGEFAEIIRMHGMESADPDLLITLKIALWALGNIGSTSGGLAFLEDEEILEAIIEIAEESPVLTLRGTSFFVLGLISTTRQGAELLEEHGWVSVRTAMGEMTGLCLPSNIDKFTQLSPWKRPDITTMPASIAKLPGLDGEIMTWIANLSNYVLAASAMNNLKRTRNRHPSHFASVTLFHSALRIISANHYQAPVRAFILDLFSIQLQPEVLRQLGELDAAAERVQVSATPSIREGQRYLSPDDFRSQTSDMAASPELYREDDEADIRREDSLHAHEVEKRRRSLSYPGPRRPAATRARGLSNLAQPE